MRKIAVPPTPRYDVAVLTDFRYPGGVASTIAEETRVQAAAGMTTAFLHVPSGSQDGATGFPGRIGACLRDRVADLPAPGDAVAAHLLVIRRPHVLPSDLSWVRKVAAEEVVVVVDASPADLDGRPRFDLAELRDRIESRTASRVRWVAASPTIRRAVLAAHPEFPLADEDWHTVIDVSRWITDRTHPVDTVPVIGRHTGSGPGRWPREQQDLLAAYPASGAMRVRVLGDRPPAKIRRSPAWEIHPYGSVSARAFLRSIDFFVYMSDPRLVETSGRAVLEAMASGVPAVLSRTCEPIFGDAAVYADPSEVAALVRDLYRDWARYREVAARASAMVSDRFGHHKHLARLSELGVSSGAKRSRRIRRDVKPRSEPVLATPGAGASGASASGVSASGASTSGASTSSASTSGGSASGGGHILMLSSNGAGLGHLTRLMSIARRLPSSVRVTIATQSYAAPVVQAEGFLTEYVPSRAALRASAARADRLLNDRLRHLIQVHEPNIVVFDGAVPYNGLLAAMSGHPELTWVWVRRPMWKRGLGHLWIERGRAFDAVLEPGEFAADADVGATVAERARAFRVAPITYLDSDQVLSRDEARAELGLDDAPAALLQLGAGNINDIATPAAQVARRLLDAGFRIVLAESPIAMRPVEPAPGVVVVKKYPLSRYLRAFDLAVSASGYNSYHELIAQAVPTVFIPNQQTGLDDQVARARYADAVGVALAVDDAPGHDLESVLERAIDPEVRAGLAKRCLELSFANGAVAAAAWLAQLTQERLPVRESSR